MWKAKFKWQNMGYKIQFRWISANFSINKYSGLQIRTDELRLRSDCQISIYFLTCCSMEFVLDPSGLCGRNRSIAGPLVNSCSRRRDFVPGGCSQWRTVSWCSNTQLQMAADVKLRSLRGKIWQQQKNNNKKTLIKRENTIHCQNVRHVKNTKFFSP